MRGRPVVQDPAVHSRGRRGPSGLPPGFCSGLDEALRRRSHVPGGAAPWSCWGPSAGVTSTTSYLAFRSWGSAWSSHWGTPALPGGRRRLPGCSRSGGVSLGWSGEEPDDGRRWWRPAFRTARGFSPPLLAPARRRRGMPARPQVGRGCRTGRGAIVQRVVGGDRPHSRRRGGRAGRGGRRGAEEERLARARARGSPRSEMQHSRLRTKGPRSEPPRPTRPARSAAARIVAQALGDAAAQHRVAGERQAERHRSRRRGGQAGSPTRDGAWCTPDGAGRLRSSAGIWLTDENSRTSRISPGAPAARRPAAASARPRAAPTSRSRGTRRRSRSSSARRSAARRSCRDREHPATQKKTSRRRLRPTSRTWASM